MKFIVLILAFGILIMSCNDYKSDRLHFASKIPITKTLLTHRWIADSIFGSESFIQDIIFFSPTNEFWRFSYYNKTYIIDSSLTYQNDSVYRNNKLVYSIVALDSTTLLLITATDTLYQLRRRGDFRDDRVREIVKSNEKKLLINGKWRLDSSDYVPAYFPSYCRNLFPGSILSFGATGLLALFPKDSLNKC